MQILLALFLSSLALLASIHITALKFFLYWKHLWLDIPVHILGGICVALGFSILPFFRIRLSLRYAGLFVYIALVVTVGIIWEIFELISGMALIDEDYLPDTFVDLCMDIFGGVAGYGIVKSIKKLE